MNHRVKPLGCCPLLLGMQKTTEDSEDAVGSGAPEEASEEDSGVDSVEDSGEVEGEVRMEAEMEVMMEELPEEASEAAVKVAGEAEDSVRWEGGSRKVSEFLETDLIWGGGVIR